jgi:hypothetical protein
MKKILVVLALGGLLLVLFLFLQGRKAGDTTTASVAASSTGAASALTTTPATAAATSAPLVTDATACARLSALCSTSDHAVDTAQCEKQLADARKMSGEANVVRSEQCLGDAKTCAAASGCLSGGVGMGAMGEFLKGLGTALSH